jgi:poly-gamma-glutamate synthesis protein (capsule biosynthesis protein)
MFVGAALTIAACAAAAYVITREDEPRVAAASTATTKATEPTTTTIPVPTTPARDPVRGSGQPVTLAFGGDVHFDGALRAKLLADPNTVLAPIAPTLSAADVAVVNLETAITEGGTIQTKEFNFRAPASALDALKAAGIDAASMANNHGMDFGVDGLADTLAAKQAKQFGVIGIGNNAAEAYAPYKVEVKGQRISVIAATDVLDSQYYESWTSTETKPGLASAKEEFGGQGRLIAAVQQARADSDTVAVILHWGVSKQDCPSPRQKALARILVDAGADIVVGGHAHHVQGAGRLGAAVVAYGLGNFVFYNESGEYGRSGVLKVTATGHSIDSSEWIPARIHGGVATPTAPGPETDEAIAHMNNARACTDLTP